MSLATKPQCYYIERMANALYNYSYIRTETKPLIKLAKEGKLDFELASNLIKQLRSQIISELNSGNRYSDKLKKLVA